MVSTGQAAPSLRGLFFAPKTRPTARRWQHRSRYFVFLYVRRLQHRVQTWKSCVPQIKPAVLNSIIGNSTMKVSTLSALEWSAEAQIYRYGVGNSPARVSVNAAAILSPKAGAM